MKNNGLQAWEANAEFWDNYMGDDSNFFHRDIVRPNVEKLLKINENDYVLDIACGNGNFSARMANLGAKVVAFDYSEKMIKLAKKRRHAVLDRVSFHVCDAANYAELLKLQGDQPFTKAVSNMAVMDIVDIKPLFKAVYQMLDDEGVFVFATHHPCFTFENGDYLSSYTYKGIAVEGQPVEQNYFHRPITDIFNTALNAGFVIDGFEETPLENEKIPIIMTVRLRKQIVSTNTKKREYNQLAKLTLKEMHYIITRNNIDELLLVPLSAGEYHEKWRQAQDICLILATHNNDDIRCNAILGLSYIARNHNKLSKRLVKPYILKELRENVENRGTIIDAIEDINRYLNWNVGEKMMKKLEE